MINFVLHDARRRAIICTLNASVGILKRAKPDLHNLAAPDSGIILTGRRKAETAFRSQQIATSEIYDFRIDENFKMAGSSGSDSQLHKDAELWRGQTQTIVALTEPGHDAEQLRDFR